VYWPRGAGVDRLDHADQATRHAGAGGADGEGECVSVGEVHAHQLGRVTVSGNGLYGATDARPIEDPGQCRGHQQRDGKRREPDEGNRHAADLVARCQRSAG